MSRNLALTHFHHHDPKIYQLLVDHDINLPRPKENLFQSLASAIIGQQLSTKVADVIEERFLNLFPNRVIDPQQILIKDDQALRDVGLSWAKVSYLKNLSEHVLDHSLNLAKLSDLDDTQVIDQLTQVKGIGPWTAEMFLIFSLGRPDVFSHGDLGLKIGMMKIYDFGEYTPTKAEPIIEKWKPYRSYGALAVWKNLDSV